MEDRHAVASSVFFTGVSLVIDKDRLRQHFETVGHVVNFTVYGPATGKDFRYGIAGYMDPQTAEEAIRRLNGTTFGERAMRVTPARATSLHGPLRAGPGGEGSGPADHTPFHKRPRDAFGSSSSSSARPPFTPGRGRGRGDGGFRGPPGRAPYAPFAGQAGTAAAAPPPEPAPPTDKDGRETMVFPRFYVDPVLGREGSLVLESLRGMATEEAYAAMEQLRVLALERPSEAKRLLHHNPALKSAVVITLQHAGRLPFGSLPRDAYLSRRGMEAEAEAVAPEAPPPPPPPPRPTQEQDATPLSTPADAAPAETPTDATAADASSAPATSAPAPTPAQAAPPPPKPTKKDAKPARKREATTAGRAAAASSSSSPSSSSAPMTDAERDEVLQLIQNMSEEDVERVLTMSPGDLAQVPDAVQRRQLEVLQKRLLEMSKDL